MPTQASTAEPIAQPFTLRNGTRLKNRLAKSAMSETLGTTDNRVTKGLARLYERWADGGCGLLITGNVMVDRRALGEPNNVSLEDERDLESLKQWAAAGKRNDTQIWMQINHPGKQSPKGLNAETVAPSAIPFSPSLSKFFSTPRELTEGEIRDIIARFARTASIAEEAGFNGVQIHGAHGYLVSQFLSSHHNRRTDSWGGTPENRRRFVLEVFRAIRGTTGPDFSVGIKLNSADFQKGGFSEEESLDVVRALSDAGIDLIEISGGTYEAPAMAGKSKQLTKESTRKREAYFLEFAERARKATKTPLMLTGGFRTVEGMAAAVSSGAVDFVGLARLLAIETDAPKRLLLGQQPQFQVKPIKTGLKFVDRMALMEVSWYERQLHRMAKGCNPRPNESGLASLLLGLMENGFKTFKTKRLRA